jgi:hypothetical protein
MEVARLLKVVDARQSHYVEVDSSLLRSLVVCVMVSQQPKRSRLRTFLFFANNTDYSRKRQSSERDIQRGRRKETDEKIRFAKMVLACSQLSGRMLGHMSLAVDESHIDDNPLNQAAGLYRPQMPPGSYRDTNGMPLRRYCIPVERSGLMCQQYTTHIQANVTGHVHLDHRRWVCIYILPHRCIPTQGIRPPGFKMVGPCQ